MGVRENKVEKYLDNEIKKLGGTTRKWVSPGRDGVPDRLVRVPDWPLGVVNVVEVKTLSGKLQEEQKREHVRLTDEGWLVYTVYGHEGVDDYIAKIKRDLIDPSRIMGGHY